MQTITEKILSSHAGKKVYAGELAVVWVDGIMASNANVRHAVKAFEEMGGVKLWDAQECTFVIDHASPALNERIANLHKFVRDFAVNQSIRLFDVGEGICHQLLVERDFVRPMRVFIGADSHTCT